MAGLGVCRPEDLALSVLTTVIGRQSDGSALIIDAGWMALSRDTGLPWKREEFGYGLVCDEAGNLIPGLRVTETNQEHGIVSGVGGGAFTPGGTITREQLAVMLYRYARHEGYDTAQGGMAIREFGDFAQISGYALEAMTWVVEAGVLTGLDGALAPGQAATRVQTAQALLALSGDPARFHLPRRK